MACAKGGFFIMRSAQPAPASIHHKTADNRPQRVPRPPRRQPGGQHARQIGIAQRHIQRALRRQVIGVTKAVSTAAGT